MKKTKHEVSAAGNCKKKTWRSFWHSALVGILCGGLIVGGLYLLDIFEKEEKDWQYFRSPKEETEQGTAVSAPEQNNGSAVPSRYEGTGFGSPEEAVSAYLTALQECDTETMLSTFAIETVAKNLDFERYCYYYDYRADSALYLWATLPTDTAFGYELAVLRRAADLSEAIATPFFLAAESRFEDLNAYMYGATGIPGAGYTKSEEEWKAMLDTYRSENCAPALQAMKYGEPSLDPKWEEYLDDGYGKSYRSQMLEVYDADDYSQYQVEVNIDGNDCLFSMALICYDGVWYNFECGTLTHPMTQYTGGFFAKESEG